MEAPDNGLLSVDMTQQSSQSSEIAQVPITDSE